MAPITDIRPMAEHPRRHHAKVRALVSATHLSPADPKFISTTDFIRTMYGEPLILYHAAGRAFQTYYELFAFRFFTPDEIITERTQLSDLLAGDFERNIDETSRRLPNEPFAACEHMITTAQPDVLIAIKGEPWTHYLQFMAVSRDIPIITVMPEPRYFGDTNIAIGLAD